MKLLLGTLIFFAPPWSQADILLVHSGKVYAVEMKTAPFAGKYSTPTKEELSKARFVVVNGGDSASVRVQKVSLMGPVKKPVRADASPAEGCKKNPMLWLKAARHVAAVEYGPEVFAVQVPDGYKEESGKAFDGGEGDLCQGRKTAVFKGEKDWLGYELCSDELNDYARIMKQPLGAKDGKWIYVGKFTMSDNCP